MFSFFLKKNKTHTEGTQWQYLHNTVIIINTSLNAIITKHLISAKSKQYPPKHLRVCPEPNIAVGSYSVQIEIKQGCHYTRVLGGTQRREHGALGKYLEFTVCQMSFISLPGKKKIKGTRKEEEKFDRFLVDIKPPSGLDDTVRFCTVTHTVIDRMPLLFSVIWITLKYSIVKPLRWHGGGESNG